MTTVLTSASTLKSFSSKKLFSCTQFELSKILSSKNVALAEMNLDEECELNKMMNFSPALKDMNLIPRLLEGQIRKEKFCL